MVLETTAGVQDTENVAGLVKKDVLWTGRWRYPDEELRLGTADLRQVVANGNAMIRNGLAVKWCWDHQPGVIPMPASAWSKKLADPAKAAEFSKSIIADAVGFELGSNSAGKPVVHALFDPDRLQPNELRQIQKAGTVSCRLDHNFKEPRAGGLKFPGWSISHIAVTPKPVELRQEPFILMSRADWPSDRTVFMGEGAPMAAEKDETPTKDAPPKDAAPAEEPKEEPTLGGAGADFKELLANLSALGFVAPESVTNIKTLNVALAAIAANGGLDDMAGDDDDVLDPNAPEATTGAPGGGMPMMMGQAEMAKRYPARVANDRAEAVAVVRTAVREGRIPANVGDQYLADLTKFEMSYVGGQLKRAGVLSKIDMLADLPKGTFLTGKRFGLRKSFKMGRNGSATEGVDPPEKFNTRKSPDEATAEADAEYIRKQAEKNNPVGAKC
jgi:hypothetical protein